MEVQYNQTKPPHIWCATSSHGAWERVWGPPPRELLPKVIDCWWHKMEVHYNNSNHHDAAHNAPGVQLRVHPGAEGLVVEPHQPETNVYRQLLQRFQNNTHVLTYDFRLSPTGNPHIVQQLQQKIQDVYWQHGGGQQRRVTLVSHSMGALWVHYLLTQTVSDAWKEKYIHAWIPMAPAYGGVVQSLQDVISGDTKSPISIFRDKMLKKVMRTFEGIFWMLPAVPLYGHEVLVELQEPQISDHQDNSGTRYYTAHDYAALFADAGFENFGFMWQRIQNLTVFSPHGLLADPGVNVYPIYGRGVETVVKYVYHSSFDSEPIKVTDHSGDGTIQGRGLRAGNYWNGTPLELENTTHIDVCFHPDALDFIEQIILSVFVADS